MFFYKKKDYSHTNWIDFHLHIVADVDDGATNIEESIKMAKLLCEQNVCAVVATPHYVYGSTRQKPIQLVKDRFAELVDRLEKENIPLILHQAFEVRASEELLYSKNLNDLTIYGTKYILIEAPFSGDIPWINEFLYTLKAWGLSPILVHPERCLCFSRNMDVLEDLVEQGVLLQLNSGSFIGIYGQKVQSAAMTILKKGWMHLVGSDAHSSVQAASFKMGLERIMTKAQMRDFDDILCYNANKVLSCR